MPGWDPNQYLKYASERARPAADLIAQIKLDRPGRIVDLGCGPGNSTEQLHRRWPESDITGVDNSPEMLAQARSTYPDWQWVLSDIEGWKPEPALDLIFSNAALHWVPGHATLFRALFGAVAVESAD